MTSISSTMGHMARGIGNNNVGAVLKQLVNISNVFARVRHAVCLCRRIHNGNKWRTWGEVRCLQLPCYWFWFGAV